MKTLILTLLLTLGIEAFELDFSKPITDSNKKTKKINDTEKLKLVKVKGKINRIIINYDDQRELTGSIVKLNAKSRYNPNSESEKLMQNTQKPTHNSAIKNLDSKGEMKHINPASISASTRKQFLRSLSVFNH